MTTPTPLEHVVVHIRDALATDGRVGELGLDVAVVGGHVVVRGSVTTASRKEQILVVVQEQLAAHGCSPLVRDDTEVTAGMAPHAQPEAL